MIYLLKLSTDLKRFFYDIFNILNLIFFRDERQYLHKIHELEINLRRLDEDATDKEALLESVQGDKETISR
jgi:hypothetical protein